MAVLYGTLQNGQLVPVEADSQGRLVAELANPVAGFRSVLINGNLVINQRGIDVAAAAIGSYGQDRWKKTASGMTQIIEEGSFEPDTVYTLSGAGVTTQQLTAPASGNWTLPDLPVTARKIQLEPGPVATPFEQRPYGTELALCQRYYETVRVRGSLLNTNSSTGSSCPLSVQCSPKRSTPSIEGLTSLAIIKYIGDSAVNININSLTYTGDGLGLTLNMARRGATAAQDLWFVNNESINLDSEL